MSEIGTSHRTALAEQKQRQQREKEAAERRRVEDLRRRRSEWEKAELRGPSLDRYLSEQDLNQNLLTWMKPQGRIAEQLYSDEAAPERWRNIVKDWDTPLSTNEFPKGWEDLFKLSESSEGEEYKKIHKKMRELKAVALVWKTHGEKATVAERREHWEQAMGKPKGGDWEEYVSSLGGGGGKTRRRHKNGPKKRRSKKKESKKRRSKKKESKKRRRRIRRTQR